MMSLIYHKLLPITAHDHYIIYVLKYVYLQAENINKLINLLFHLINNYN